jgi:hypothetical protein
MSACAYFFVFVQHLTKANFAHPRDFHGRVHRPLAKQLAKALEPHCPLFIEEPLLPGQQQELKGLYGMTSIPIAVSLRRSLTPNLH